eukprot:5248934-Prorocentrum_lima.AAC.1
MSEMDMSQANYLKLVQSFLRGSSGAAACAKVFENGLPRGGLRRSGLLYSPGNLCAAICMP